MTIKFLNGQEVEGVLLAQTSSTLRVAIAGYEDALGLKGMNGLWVSDDLDPVMISYSWERQPAREYVTEADCICTPELAERLIDYLLYGSDEAEEPVTNGIKPLTATAAC